MRANRSRMLAIVADVVVGIEVEVVVLCDNDEAVSEPVRDEPGSDDVDDSKVEC